MSAFASVAVILFSAVAASAQTGEEAKGAPAQSGAVWKAEGEKGIEPRSLSAEQERLVRGSKAAVLAAGISEPYFERHFTLMRVSSRPGDNRVVWLFKVGEYEAIVSDSVGFYTDERGRRVDAHSVVNALGEARDIKRTISRRRAESIMRRCIGEYEGGNVTYNIWGVPGRATLLFNAVSVPPAADSTKPAPPTSQPAPPVGEGSTAADYMKPGGKKKPFRKIGAVNLETGRCTKGLAQVGAPVPQPSSK